MYNKLKIKCNECGLENKIMACKTFIKQPSSDPQALAMIPAYIPLDVCKCRVRENYSGTERVYYTWKMILASFYSEFKLLIFW